MKITNPNDSRFIDVLYDWNVRYNLMLSDAILASDSPAERTIYKLLNYLETINIRNDPIYQEARTKGLKPCQIRYFFRSYEPTEKRRLEFGFIDQIRFSFKRLDPSYRLIDDRPKGWMTQQKLNKHLKNLVRIKAIEKVDTRYRQVKGKYYNPGLPNYYKRMIKGVPAEWMVPCTGNVRTNLVYLRDRDSLNIDGPRIKGRPTYEAARAREERARHLKKFEEELLERCDAFGTQIRQLYEKYMDRLDLEETQYIKGLREIDKIIATGQPSNDYRKVEPDSEGSNKHSIITEADFDEWKRKIHEYWGLMPILLIDPHPRPDEAPLLFW